MQSTKMHSFPMSIFYHEDAFTFSQKIMGRQAAGKSFLKSICGAPQFSEFELILHGNAVQAPASVKELSLQTEKKVRIASVDQALHKGRKTIFFPAPVPRRFSQLRSQYGNAASSFVGITHSLSSEAAIDSILDMAYSPFEQWDALICTSNAAKTFAENLISDHQDLASFIHKDQLSNVQLPVIPLGVDKFFFTIKDDEIAIAKNRLSIKSESVVILNAGRLSFHAKWNPIAFYLVLEELANQFAITVVNAGVFPNESIRREFSLAQSTLCPSVTFVDVDGANEERFQDAWRAADIFVSLSDNVQETFGLTPVEAMAAGKPVVASDWSGYRENIRNGVDGFLIPTTMSHNQSIGHNLAQRHLLGDDTYDIHIGKLSCLVSLDNAELLKSLKCLIESTELRRRFGDNGRRRASSMYCWESIFDQYTELANQLAEIRIKAISKSASFLDVYNPLRRFQHFSTRHLDWSKTFRLAPFAEELLNKLDKLSMCTYVLEYDPALSFKIVSDVFMTIRESKVASVNEIIAARVCSDAALVEKSVLWLLKFNVIVPDS